LARRTSIALLEENVLLDGGCKLMELIKSILADDFNEGLSGIASELISTVSHLIPVIKS
jgi:hypothetical protein